MAELITMYMARRELVNAAFRNRTIICPECNGDCHMPSFIRRTVEGFLVFDHAAVEKESCFTCNNKGIVAATEDNVTKEMSNKIITGYIKKLSRQARAKKATGQTWNRNRIKNDPRFK